ncbi:hypothetical protein KC717_07015 [Candidatus Dojkabacteria bacterium]|uniref:Uncharacterized protein n=1 Tax=Candidatus Dojkabacteria bacterium TaxID=2099670 RepID=A0A955RLH3_9BACT|nr:hypothetical protein [Candidatus Dojkabacteria bacterium]
MQKIERKIIDNNLQYFKGTIGKIVNEIDFRGASHEMLMITNVYKQKTPKKQFADYALVNRNKTTEFLFELASNTSAKEIVNFQAKVIEYRNVQLYDGMNFMHHESYCKLGYLKDLHVHFPN